MKIKRTFKWIEHGDSEIVMKYGESIINQYPAYAKCGYIIGEGMHVMPGDVITIVIERKKKEQQHETK